MDLSPQPRYVIQSGGRQMTSDELIQQGRRAASGFAALSIGQGDRVAYLLRNDFPCFVLHQAAQLQGFDAVPINWHLKPREVGYILADCNARVVVAHQDLLTDDMRAELHDRTVLAVPVPSEIADAYAGLTIGSGSADQLSWDDWLASYKPTEVESRRVVPPLFYTSGSSGTPKAVIRQAIAAEKAAQIAARTRFAWGFDATEVRSVMTGPLYHSAPNGYAHMVLAAGTLLVLQPRFDAQELLQIIETQRITHLHLVPTMFSRLLALPDAVKSQYDLNSLRYVTHGAAPCPPDVKRRMIEWWGEVIHEYYAMTETGIITCSSSSEWLSHPGSVGRAAPGVQLRITDEDGVECAPRQSGNICVRHEATDAVAYANDAPKTAKLRSQGYLVTGDVGFIDEDGFLYLTDRKSDMIISGGVNIYPAEIEAALASMPEVSDVAVFGLPHPDLGEQVVAVLQVRKAMTAADVRAFLAAHLANFKIPRRIEFVDNLPREDSGKIKKRQLAATYR